MNDRHFSHNAQYNISSVKMWLICQSRANEVVMASHMLYWKILEDQGEENSPETMIISRDLQLIFSRAQQIDMWTKSVILY